MRYLALLIAYAIWLVVGAILWVPFIVRTMTVYMGAIIISVYRQRDVGMAERALSYALGFYGHGFAMISRTLAARSHDPSTAQITEHDVWRTIVEIGFALVFWVLTLFLLHELDIYPFGTSTSVARTEKRVLRDNISGTGSSVRLNWTETHWFRGADTYAIDIYLNKLEAHNSGILFWRGQVADIFMQVCNRSSHTIDGQTIYVSFISGANNALISWKIDLPTLSEGICQDAFAEADVSGEILQNGFSGSVSYSTAENGESMNGQI